MLLFAFRRVIWFTVLGVLAIVAVGPVFAVAGTILPFALIGALVWLAWMGAARLAAHFSTAAVREKLAPETVPPAAALVGRKAGCAIRQGVYHCRAAAPVLREQARRVHSKIGAYLRTAARMMVEIASGAAVGGLAAWYMMGTEDGVIAVGALLGGALGFVVGGPKREASSDSRET